MMSKAKVKSVKIKETIIKGIMKRRSVISVMVLAGALILSYNGVMSLKDLVHAKDNRIAELEGQVQNLQEEVDFKDTENQVYIDLYNDNESTIKTMKMDKDNLEDALASAKSELETAKKTISASKKYSTDNLSRGDVSEKSLKDYEILSVEEMNDFINRRAPENSPFRNNGEIFLEAAKQSGLDPKYIVAIAGLESSWGRSTIAREKKNYFGITAYNNDPYNSAKSFSSMEDGIVNGAIWIKNNFVDKGKTNLVSMIWGGSAYCQTNEGQPSQSWIDNITTIIKP